MKFPYGIDIEVVKALADVYNFTIEYIEPPPGEFWGVLTENGTWNGMVGKISRNEADMGVANLFLTLHRLGAVDYSAPYDAEVSCFMARTDPPAPRWKSLSLPFQLPTWLAMLVGLLSIAAIAINRCVLITIPKWYPKIFTATNTAVTIACIWLLSVVLLLFPLLEAYGKFGYNDSTDECDFVDSTERGQTPRNVMMFAGYFFPCGVIIVSYALIFYKARMSSIKMKAFSQGNAQNTANKTAQRPAVGLRSRDIRIARTIAAIFVAFIICCTPVSVLHYLDKTMHMPTTLLLLHPLYWLQYCLNMFIYVIMNSQYREAYVHFVAKWWPGVRNISGRLFREPSSDSGRSQRATTPTSLMRFSTRRGPGKPPTPTQRLPPPDIFETDTPTPSRDPSV
ncbi:G-protein coupled receptor moody-like isoform X2 [Penaeus monodon]|uniref:G-protein coupled receptor moody-like isoform X2 n=1 Tax=Penaeus monodon TaxID=6687 RepID=UPI0018A7956F|nr:G-protein coupled receptor moody-like isoform X2 [Penaeus monodon]